MIDVQSKPETTRRGPPRIIDYVVLHELVHVVEPRHDTAFWQKVERAMPDYASRKEWLAEYGHQF